MYTIKEAFPVEDGALHGPRGRYFLPILGSAESDDKLTGTHVVFLSVLGLLFAALILLTSNWLAKDYNKSIRVYQNYIGMSRTEVLQSLEIGEDTITEISAGAFLLSKKSELYGVDFDVILHFDSLENLLCGYGYTVSLVTPPEGAAKIVADFVNQLGYKLENGEVLILDRETLLQGFIDKEEFHLNQSWNLTPGKNAGGKVGAYLTHMENSADWPGRVAGLLAIPAAWYRDLDISYDPHDQVLSIQLKYGAEARRTGVVNK